MTTPPPQSENRTIRFSRRLYRLLLLAYPKPFRDAYGEAMAQTFGDQAREVEQKRRGLAELWRLTVFDLISSAFRERREAMQKRGLLLLVAVAFGLALAWVDSRPKWDDTGIIVVSLFGLCALFGAIGPKNAWQWTLAVGIWIPLYEIAANHNFSVILALVPAFLGTYLGVAIRLALFPPTSPA